MPNCWHNAHMAASRFRVLRYAAGYAGETPIPRLNQLVKLYGDLSGGEIMPELSHGTVPALSGMVDE
jgi:hypothetical protein